MLNKKLLKKLVVMLLVASPSLAVSQCVKDSEPGAFGTTCSCTGAGIVTTSCYSGYPGESCQYDLPGNFCGSKGHVDCYIAYAYSGDCVEVVNPKKSALLRDDLETNFKTEREANLRTCGDPDTLRRWLETAPGFPARKSSQSGF
jgi:hypothetical protein